MQALKLLTQDSFKEDYINGNLGSHILEGITSYAQTTFAHINFLCKSMKRLKRNSVIHVRTISGNNTRDVHLPIPRLCCL